MAKPPPRLYVTDDLSSGAVFSLPKEEAHYLGSVLRLGEGTNVLLFNGRDGEWLCEIAEISRKGGQLRILEQSRSHFSSPDLTLLFAPVKKSPTELIVQKATELGVRHLRPVMTQRTMTKRVSLDRFEVIAKEAAEQCERLDVPSIGEPQTLEEVLNEFADYQIMFCDEAGDRPDQRWGGDVGRASSAIDELSQTSGEHPWAILTGPEGGFSPIEREKLRAQSNIVPVSLGPRILKAETAAIVAITLWQASFGDMR